MRTTLDIDRTLLERAKEVLDAASFTEAIERALTEAVARAEVRRGWEGVMASDLSWGSVDELLEYRRRHGGRAL